MGKDDSNNSIVLKLWDFMNESPILSAVIISFIAIISSQLVKIYTYIYWLPYFDFFKIPLFYFDIAIYDKYLLAFEIIPIIFITMVFFSFIQYAEKKCKITLKLGLVKSFILT